MKTLYIDKVPRVIKNKQKLEKALSVKITNKGREVMINGHAEDEYFAEKILDALNLGFPFKVALMIRDENLELEILNIKDYTKKQDLSKIRARIIGTKGKTLKTLSQLTDCFFETKNNEIGIIGDSENLKGAREAVINLIKGSKQSNVYKYLEQHRPQPILDLGLKEPKKKTRKKKK